MAFLYGTRARIRVTFTDPTSGAAVDPAVVKLTVRLPSGARTEYQYGSSAVVREAVGRYAFELLLDFLGSVAYRWDSMAEGQEAAEESSFSVVVSAT